jgi:hypothetical protein
MRMLEVKASGEEERRSNVIDVPGGCQCTRGFLGERRTSEVQRDARLRGGCRDHACIGTVRSDIAIAAASLEACTS